MCVNYQMHHSDVCPPYFKLYDSWSTHTPTCMDTYMYGQKCFRTDYYFRSGRTCRYEP